MARSSLLPWMVSYYFVLLVLVVPNITQTPPGPPVITGPASINNGETVTITCTSTGGDPTPTVKWLRDDNVLDDTSTTSGGVTVNEYTFTASPAEHQGVFECQTDNGVLQNPLTRTLFVIFNTSSQTPTLTAPPGPPVITGPDIIRNGETVIITCSSTGGDPTSTVKWLRDDAVVDDTSTTSGGVTRNSYAFTASLAEHLEVFECQTENGVLQNPLTSTLFVIVNTSPQTPTLTGTSTPAPNQQSTWTCTSTGGYPAPTMTMRIGNNQFSTNEFTTTSMTTDSGRSYTVTGTLNWSPTIGNNGQTLFCDVAHPTTLNTPQTVSLPLTVIAPLTISATPTFYNLTIGTSVTLNCVVTSGTATSITWLKDNSILNINGTPPVVTIGQSSYSQLTGQQITLGCTVLSNNSPLQSVHWTFTNQGGSVTDPISISTSSPLKYIGSTTSNPSLTVYSVTSTEQGIYRCRASNMIGTTTSNPTVLSVTGSKPTLQIPQSTYSDTYGNQATIPCSITSATPSATNVYWTRNQNNNIININNGDSGYQGSTVGSPSLTINFATTGSNGVYTCYATNAVGTGASNLTTLTITGGLLSVDVSPNSVNVVQGTNQQITCTVTGTPAATGITWRRLSNDQLTTLDIVNSNGKYTGGTTSNPHLTINNFQSSDAGTYVCRATNAAGSQNSDNSVLTYIHNRPLATDILKNLTMVDINGDNIKTVIETVKNVTSDPGILTSIDVIAIADVLVHIPNDTLINQTVVIDILDIIDNVLNVDPDKLKKAQNDGSATNRLLEVLETIYHTLDLGNQSSMQFLTENILVNVFEITSMSSPVIGIQIEAGKTQSLTTSNIQNVIADTNITVGKIDAAIILPVELINNINKSTRVTLSIYRNWNLFSVRPDIREYMPNSRVVSASISVDGIPIYSLGQYRVQALFFPRMESENNECGYWNYDLHDRSGGWATSGCYLNRTEYGRHICVCDHLTNFAVLVNIGGQDTLVDSMAINIISWIGLMLSIAGLSLTIISFFLFKHLRKGRPQQTLFNLALSMLCFLIVFIVGIEQTQDFYVCIVVAVLLHYFILVAFMWMLMEGILQYLRFVKVLGTYIPRFILKTAVPAWGVPLIPVVIVVGIDHELYHGGKKACWMSLTAFYYAFAIPVGIIILVNAIIFGMILKNILGRPKGLQSNQSERKRAMMNFRAAFSVFVLLGLTWIFGFFTIEEASIVFQYIFTILNVFQGFLIFVLFTAREKQVRQNWKKLCCKEKPRKKYTISEPSSEMNKMRIRNNDNNSGSDTREVLT